MARPFAHPGRHLVVGESELLDQLLVGGRLLEGVEVLAVKVLDQRLLEADRVAGVGLDQDPDGLEPGPTAARHRRSPAISS